MMPADASPETAAAHLRRRLRGKTGRAFWQALEACSQDPAVQQALATEFPAIAPMFAQPTRRNLLKIMGASLAMAGLAGCDAAADEKALPYVKAPEFTAPGQPKWYATAVTLNGYAQPVLGKTYVGRPVKLEGNRDHPASNGTSDAFTQAALLGLYDPDRSQTPRQMGRVMTWDAFDAALATRLAHHAARRGEGLRLLTGTVTSPTLSQQIDDFQQHFPQARWHAFEPVGEEAQLQATVLACGKPLLQHMRLDLASVVIALDHDFLGPGPRQSWLAKGWADRRRQQQAGRGTSRLFVAEPFLTPTGAMAERRLISHPARMNVLLQAFLRSLDQAPLHDLKLEERETQWLAGAMTAIKANPAEALITVGTHYPPEVQALAILLNGRLGAHGRLMQFTDPIAKLSTDGLDTFDRLVRDMDSGAVETLIILNSNPVYSAAGKYNFLELLERVDYRIHAGLYYDETASNCHWHIPLHHDLESWSDARASDGTLTILQPLVRPLYDTASPHDLLARLTGRAESAYDIVRARWRGEWAGAFDQNWSEGLQRGYMPQSAAAIVTPPALAPVPLTPLQEIEGLSVVIRPDPATWDGRFANNAWLQELPRPLTKITWGNVIAVAPRFARERDIANGDELQVTVNGKSVSGPAWIMPGASPRTIGLTLGYGRTRSGTVGNDVGYDAFIVDDPARRWNLPGIELRKTGNRLSVATTQLYQQMDGFDFVRSVSRSALAEAGAATGGITTGNAEDEASFYPPRQSDGPSWGMAIDLDLCIGCNACVVACMAENNVPVVGKELIAEGRQMHWLRVDHYYEGDPDEPASYFQPVPCMHCEQAPCEMGCPVNAAVHSFDGLNLQVYNRCIGTRTCSSYCPYKVRRFNWFDFTADAPEQIRALRNPDVTVRQRGVMEKCTYCVQRISRARIAAKIAGRELADGDVTTACQQACPARAISFGDVHDANAQVSQWKSSVRNYSLLEEANTRPRTTYLARIETGDVADGDKR